jgi:hypothetical protein
MIRRAVIGILVVFVGFVGLIGVFIYSDPMARELILNICDGERQWEQRVPGDGGYSLTYFQRDCGVVIAQPYEEGVFAERSRFPWPWPERRFIFSYPQDASRMNIIPTGPNSVTISAEHVDAVFLAETQWGALKIDYNIGTIQAPRPTDPVVTGFAWAEREAALVERARSQKIRLTGRDPLGQ